MKYFLLFILFFAIAEVSSGQTKKTRNKQKTISSQKKKKSRVKENSKKDTTTHVLTEPLKIDTTVKTTIPIIIHDTVDNTKPQLDSVKEEIAKSKIEIQKGIQNLLLLYNSNYDSLKSYFSKSDSTRLLKLDTLVEQTKPEGFWKGFIKNTINTWLYDKIFGSSEKTGTSFFERLLTFLAIVIRFGLLIYRLKDYFSKSKGNEKPSKLRLCFSILSWIILVYSLFSHNQNQDKAHLNELKEINQKIKGLEKINNEQITTVGYTASQLNSYVTSSITIVQKLNLDTLLIKFDSTLNNRNYALLKAQNDANEKLADIQKEQKKSETNIISELKDYSVHGFWILLLIIIIIFNRDIRNYFEKLYSLIKERFN